MRTIVGVLPAGFIFPAATLRRLDTFSGRVDYVIVAPRPSAGRRTPIVMGGMASNAIVRLKPGVSRQRAQAELDSISAGVRTRRAQDSRTIAFDDLRSLLFPTGRPVLILLLAAAGLVLLIGCANLATILTARMQRLQSELAVCSALGASRWRLMRPLLAETIFIGAVAAALALAATALSFERLLGEVPPAAYGRAHIGVGARVGLVSLALGLIGGLLVAAGPVWRSSRVDVQAVLRLANSRASAGGRGARAMIAGQVALALLVAVSAVTATRNLVAVLNEPLGFNPRNVITVDAQPEADEPVLPYFQRVVETLSQVPDVVSAGAGASTPFYNLSASEAPFRATRRYREIEVLPGYLETLQVPVRQGHLPTRDDVLADVEPAVVSEAAAFKLFPDRHAVGETYTAFDGRRFQIAAVVQDEFQGTEKIGALVYLLPRASVTSGRYTIVVRTRARNAATLAAVRRAAMAVGSRMEPVTASWMADSIGTLSTYRNPRFQTVVLGSSGVLALGLAALGVFAVVAAMVVARTREMGIRLAIGATPWAVLLHVMRWALLPMLTGLAIGALLARGAGRVTRAVAPG